MHNHPSGDPTPSRADIQVTQTVGEMARPLGISVHDHLIVGKKGTRQPEGLEANLATFAFGPDRKRYAQPESFGFISGFRASRRSPRSSRIRTREHRWRLEQ